jgi:ectoine hydroxylase-related dioxygenase (phytanoyl-CoA dioxygenase family)
MIKDMGVCAKYDAVVYALNPGDVLLHHSHAIHWSEPNKSAQSRRGLTLQFQAESDEVDPARLKHYEDSLKVQVAAREAQAKEAQGKPSLG